MATHFATSICHKPASVIVLVILEYYNQHYKLHCSRHKHVFLTIMAPVMGNSCLSVKFSYIVHFIMANGVISIVIQTMFIAKTHFSKD